jgi:hypothetical protein
MNDERGILIHHSSFCVQHCSFSRSRPTTCSVARYDKKRISSAAVLSGSSSGKK